ncbi:hypothetical protein Tco_0358640, partial [Tanacetum coccineum]
NRDDDDEEEKGPSGDEADDDEDEDEDDEEEEEHLAPADSTSVAFSAVDHVPSTEETEPFETDESVAIPPPHPAYHYTELLLRYRSEMSHLHHFGLRQRLIEYEVGESSSTAAARPTRGLRADYGFVATMDREIMWDLERDVGYGI